MNSLMTHSMIGRIVQGAAKMSAHPENGASVETYTGWRTEDGSYLTIRLYNAAKQHAWEHTFLTQELMGVASLSPAALHDYLVDHWPETFASATEVQKLQQLMDELATARHELSHAFDAVEEKLRAIRSVLEQK